MNFQDLVSIHYDDFNLNFHTLINIYRLRHKIYFIGLLLGLVVLYNEFLVYEIQAFKWSVRKCTDCVVVLLVADPQILGYKNENYKGSAWAVWDSDRYVIVKIV